MGKLIYLLNVSLDGFVETPDHRLDWTFVDEELRTWFNEHERRVEASLYGRRLYELMAGAWSQAPSGPDATPARLEFAEIWQATPKIVFSSSLDEVRPNDRLARGDIADELARIREEFPGDLNVGGAALASSFIRRGLIDEYKLVVHPVVLGTGTPYFPALERPIGLRLIESRVFGSGVTYLGYSAT